MKRRVSEVKSEKLAQELKDLKTRGEPVFNFWHSRQMQRPEECDYFGKARPSPEAEDVTLAVTPLGSNRIAYCPSLCCRTSRPAPARSRLSSARALRRRLERRSLRSRRFERCRWRSE